MKKLICILIIMLLLCNNTGYSISPKTNLNEFSNNNDWKDFQLSVNNLKDIPEELLINICSFLDFYTIINLRKLNHYFDEFIKEQIKLKLKQNPFNNLNSKKIESLNLEKGYFRTKENEIEKYKIFKKELEQMELKYQDDQSFKLIKKLFDTENFIYITDMILDPRYTFSYGIGGSASFYQKYNDSTEFFIRNIKIALICSYYKKNNLTITIEGKLFDIEKKDKKELKEICSNFKDDNEFNSWININNISVGKCGNLYKYGFQKYKLVSDGKEVSFENFFEILGLDNEEKVKEFKNKLLNKNEENHAIRYFINGIEGSCLSYIINERLAFPLYHTNGFKSAYYFFKKFETENKTIKQIKESIENLPEIKYQKNESVCFFKEIFKEEKRYNIIETLINKYEKSKNFTEFINDFKDIFSIAKEIDIGTEEEEENDKKQIIEKEKEIEFKKDSVFQKLGQDLANVLQKKINLNLLYKNFDQEIENYDKFIKLFTCKFTLFKGNILIPDKNKKKKREKKKRKNFFKRIFDISGSSDTYNNFLNYINKEKEKKLNVFKSENSGIYNQFYNKKIQDFINQKVNTYSFRLGVFTNKKENLKPILLDINQLFDTESKITNQIDIILLLKAVCEFNKENLKKNKQKIIILYKKDDESRLKSINSCLKVIYGIQENDEQNSSIIFEYDKGGKYNEYLDLRNLNFDINSANDIIKIIKEQNVLEEFFNNNDKEKKEIIKQDKEMYNELRILTIKA